MNCHDSYEDWYRTIEPLDTISDRVAGAGKVLIDELFLEHTDCDEDTIIEALLEIFSALKLDVPDIRNKTLSVTSSRLLRRTQEIYESKIVLDKEFVSRNVKSIANELYGKNVLLPFNIESSIKNLMWHCNDESPLASKTITIQRKEA